MIRSLFVTGLVLVSAIALGAKEESSHKHSEKEQAHDHKKHEGHDAKEEQEHDHAQEGEKEESHAHEGEEGHEHGEEEEGGNVGPDKGILEVNERFGFKLSPEALKNFELQFMKLNGDGPWSVNNSALVHAGEEVNVFRRRNGFFKRVDFETSKKGGASLTIDSDDLREGDEIVTSGLGFLRIAELASSGGIAHGHSH